MRIVDLSINKRLWPAILLPLVSAIGLALLQIWTSFTSYRDMERVVRVSDQIQTISGIVHALQTERGQSAGYLGARNSSAEGLQKARTAADAALRAVPDLASALTDLGDEELLRQMTIVADEVTDLPATRRGVEARSLSARQSFEAYTGLIAHFTRLASDLSLQGIGSQIGAEKISAQLLMQTK